MLDSTPLGKLARSQPRSEDYARLKALKVADIEVMVPEIIDYELRRNLLLHNLDASLRELDHLCERLIYVPLTTAAMRRAADLWASARRTGKPTAHPQALDCDVILAAQALEAGAEIISENVRHLSRYVRVYHWQNVHHAK